MDVRFFLSPFAVINRKYAYLVLLRCVFTVVQITPIAIASIDWRTFIIFAVFCALWVPIVYCFFPETNQLGLEDVDHLFEKGGITGGVFKAKGGRTVEPGVHERVPELMGEKGVSGGEAKTVQVEETV